MSSGKHSSDEEFEFEFDFDIIKNFLIIIIILAVIVGCIFGLYSIVKKMQKSKAEMVSSEEVEEVSDSKYDILGKIVIDKINVEQNILDSVDDDALDEGVIKLYGDQLNQVGNFCIAGHNNSDVFKRLDELEVDDEFVILDNENNETTYKITEIFSAEPSDLSALRSEEGKTQITLITCENYSTTRLIVKSELVQ